MENENYDQSKPLYYNYGVKHILTTDINNIYNADKYHNINLCVYYVNSEGKYPFLQYLLADNGYNILSIPKLPKNALFDNSSLVPYSKVFLSALLQTNNFDEFKNEIHFDGFYEYEYDLYLFFDITKCKIFTNQFCLPTPVCLALIDEIVNQKIVYNIQIDTNTIYFFINNETTFYLYNELSETYELPIVGYTGKPNENKTKFTSIFGESAKDKTAILGPYFYFTNLKNAIKQSTNKNIDDSNKGGIVRFALFTGVTKYIENCPNTPNDSSKIKQDRLQDESLDIKKEILTLRISDHDGVWSKTYDSVYLNEIELDDGTVLPDTPILVLKEYNQQLPLTYHYIH